MAGGPLKRLYYSIGEVSELTGVRQHILRFWENQFPILRPKKNRAGNRAYRDRDIKIILMIKRLLWDDKYTIEGARQKLQADKDFVQRQLGGSPETVPKDILSEIRQDLRELLRMLD